METITSDLYGALPNGIRPCIHLEVCQSTSSTVSRSVIKNHVLSLISQRKLNLESCLTEFDDDLMKENIVSVCLDEDDLLQVSKKNLDLPGCTIHVHVYQLHDGGPAQEEFEEEDLAAATHWMLPAIEFHGLWDSLVYDSTIKSQLLQYVSTTLLYSDKKVDDNIITWNRVVLLHGPPGTGKTSLCRALAHKLCIQLGDRYSYGQLIEINSHSLFSKWFSESGKLVMKMFQKIQEMIDDREALVCVLIDEVESLTSARKAALNGAEPSDAIRVVNAVLTQLDQIKKYSNVIILTTSNITGAIDLAFVDRADIKQYIGLPSATAIYSIYLSCIRELMRTGIIYPREIIMELRGLEVVGLQPPTISGHTNNSAQLHALAVKSQGLSGRTLRKLPFICHALFIQKPSVTLSQFLVALDKAIEKQFKDEKDLTKG